MTIELCVQHAITIYIDSLCSFVLGLTGGQIAGIVIGGLSVVAVAVIIIIILILLKKNMRLGICICMVSNISIDRLKLYILCSFIYYNYIAS